MRKIWMFLMLMPLLAFADPPREDMPDNSTAESSRDFTFNGINFTVIDEAEKTCMTKCGSYWGIRYGMGGDDFYEYDYDYDPGTIVRGNISIPEYASDGNDDYKVIEIGNFSFAGCDELLGVEISDNVKTIGVGAFAQATKLNNVDFPDSLKTIKYAAFFGCRSLQEITLNDGLEEIGMIRDEYLFIPESEYPYYESGAFSGCRSLKTVTIPESVEYLGQETFSDCDSLETVSLPDKLKDTNCEEGVFSNSGLKTIDIPKAFKRIPKSFFEYSKLESVNFNDNLESIGIFAFYMCINLSEISLPKTLKKIGTWAFGNSGLSSVKLPEGLDSIGSNAFCRTKLIKMVIPNSVNYMGSSAFEYCKNLKEIYLPNGTFELPINLLAGCTMLENVIIPSTVQKIRKEAFLDCPSLVEIHLPSDLEWIEPDAFLGCKNLKNVVYDTTDPKEVWNEEWWDKWDSKPFKNLPFESEVFETGCLKVDIGMKDKVMGLKPWKFFANIEEEDFSVVQSTQTVNEIDTPMDVYNMEGQRIASSLEGLPKGIYIVKSQSKTRKVRL